MSIKEFYLFIFLFGFTSRFPEIRVFFNNAVTKASKLFKDPPPWGRVGHEHSR